MTNKKRREKFTIEFKIKSIEKYDQMENKNISYLSNELKIDRSMLSKWLKSRESIMSFEHNGKKRLNLSGAGRKRILPFADDVRFKKRW